MEWKNKPMTPINPGEFEHPSGPVSWLGVKDMLRTYDATVIMPREEKMKDENEIKHKENLAVQNAHTKILSRWEGSFSTLKLMWGAVLLLLIAVLSWLLTDHVRLHSSLQQPHSGTYSLSEANPWKE
jgi:hypothetical protein